MAAVGYALLLLMTNPPRNDHEAKVAEALQGNPPRVVKALDYRSYGLFSLAFRGGELVTAGALGMVIITTGFAE